MQLLFRRVLHRLHKEGRTNERTDMMLYVYRWCWVRHYSVTVAQDHVIVRLSWLKLSEIKSSKNWVTTLCLWLLNKTQGVALVSSVQVLFYCSGLQSLMKAGFSALFIFSCLHQCFHVSIKEYFITILLSIVASKSWCISYSCW